MASATATEVFNCTCDEFFKIVSNYEKYPEFLSEVKDCHVIETKGTKKLVEYQISMIKTFTYSLWTTEDSPHGVSWEFNKGDIFKKMDGSWKLEDEAGRCRATYTIEASVGMWVPGAITKGLIEVNLPNMMSSYHKRVKELYGR